MSATEVLRNMPKAADTPGAFSPAVLAGVDIIAMDPRGVGGSRAVRCPTDRQRADAAAAFNPAVPGGNPLPRLLSDAAAFTAAMFEAHTAVRCADRHTPSGIAAHKTAATKAVAEAKRIGTRAAYSALNCARWPAPNKDRVTKPLTGAGTPPALVVAGRLDPVTPHH